jgi:methionyl-tRNA formyltransferase
MGSPDFSVPTLEALHAAPDIDVPLVVTQPDRPSGRGKKLTKTAVKQCAERLGLPVFDMSKETYADGVDRIRNLKPDFIVVAAFGLILRSDLLDLPPRGCINLHASLLPRHRGMSPIQASILAGDVTTGCTTMLMDEGIDTGDMLLDQSIPIAVDDTAGSLEEKLSRSGAPLVIDTIQGLRSGTIEPRKQDDDRATYARRIKKAHGRIDWSKPAADVDRRIRAMTPWPSSFTSIGGKRLIVVRATIADSSSAGAAAGATGGNGGKPSASGDPAARAPGTPGTIISTEPLCVATGDGAIELLEVKVAGKKSMSAKEFRAGYRVGVGTVLGADKA